MTKAHKYNFPVKLSFETLKRGVFDNILLEEAKGGGKWEKGKEEKGKRELEWAGENNYYIYIDTADKYVLCSPNWSIVPACSLLCDFQCLPGKQYIALSHWQPWPGDLL